MLQLYVYLTHNSTRYALCYHQFLTGIDHPTSQKLNMCHLQSCVPVQTSIVQTFGWLHDKSLLDVKARQDDDWCCLMFLSSDITRNYLPGMVPELIQMPFWILSHQSWDDITKSENENSKVLAGLIGSSSSTLTNKTCHILTEEQWLKECTHEDYYCLGHDATEADKFY
jgi:hypothetical protein